MPRTQELYSPEADAQAREAGAVFISDLCLNDVMLALKQECPPHGLGVYQARPHFPIDNSILRTGLVRAIAGVNSGQGQELEAPNQDIRVVNDPFSAAIVASVEYWHGRPLKTKFVGGKAMDAESLTGFEPFEPQRFEAIQGAGRAQEIIDALRAAQTYSDPAIAHIEECEGFNTVYYRDGTDTIVE